MYMCACVKVKWCDESAVIIFALHLCNHIELLFMTVNMVSVSVFTLDDHEHMQIAPMSPSPLHAQTMMHIWLHHWLDGARFRKISFRKQFVFLLHWPVLCSSDSRSVGGALNLIWTALLLNSAELTHCLTDRDLLLLRSSIRWDQSRRTEIIQIQVKSVLFK